MIRKIILLSALILVFAAPYALADAGSGYDDNELVKIKIKPHFDEITIGEEITFTADFTNLTDDEVELIQLWKVFVDDTSDARVDLDDIIIEPNRTMSMNFTYLVSENIHWYEKDGKYYSDFNVVFVYFAYQENTPADEGEAWDFINISMEPIPFEITNIKNGDHLLEMNITDNNDTALFIEYYNMSEWQAKPGIFDCYLYNTFEVKNISGKILKRVITQISNPLKQTFISPLQPDEIFNGENDRCFNMPKKEIPKESNITYNSMCEIDDIYYAVSAKHTYPTTVINFPLLDIRLETQVDTSEKKFQSFDGTLYITNASNYTIHNFYFQILDDTQSNNIILDGNIFPTLLAKDTMNIDITIPSEERFVEFFFGILRDDTLIYWHNIWDKATNSPLDTRTILYDNNVVDMLKYVPRPLPTPTPTIESTQLPSPTISPIPTPSLIPTPSPTIVPARRILPWRFDTLNYITLILASLGALLLTIAFVLHRNKLHNKKDKEDK